MEGFVEFIERHQLCQADDSILLAVSGGVDSMVMLQLFHDHGFTIGVAHCNFGLRDEASDGDEAFLRSYCSDRAIPFFAKRFETKDHAQRQGISIQMAARELRYRWFEELLTSEHYQWIATAHHLNDSMETVLLNLVRGTGLAGLAGIPLKNGHVIRPMQGFDKEQILRFARAQQIPWRVDASNEADDYQRNLVRNQVIPLLRQLNPALEATFRRNMERLGAAREVLEVHLQLLRKNYVFYRGSDVCIKKALLSEAHRPAFILWQFLQDLGFSYEQMDDICRSAQGQPGSQFFSPSHRLVIDREYLIVETHRDSWDQVLIESNQTTSKLGPWQLKLATVEPDSITSDKNEATLDRALVRYPITWRKWRAGDAFVPLGMHQRKKLSDFFIDIKVPLTDKDRTTVLESAGEIIWVVGHRIDDRFKVTDQTTTTLRISLHSDF